MISSPWAAALVIATLIGWDVWLLLDKIPGNTWSEVLRAWGSHTLIVPWCWGGLGGHFFHIASNDKPIIDRPGNIILLVWLTVIVAIISVVLTKLEIETTFMYTAFFLGSICWMFLWPV